MGLAVVEVVALVEVVEGAQVVVEESDYAAEVVAAGSLVAEERALVHFDLRYQP